MARRSIVCSQCLVVVALVAFLTGLAVWPLYGSSAQTAHTSALAIVSNPAIATLRGIHHWASALIILLGGLYVWTAISGRAYMGVFRPIWLQTILLTLASFFLQVTGHLLPWDQQAVRTAVVETGIAENAPVIGQLQAKILRAGDSVGPDTLSLWRLAHVALLPIVYLALVWILYKQLKRLGAPVARRAPAGLLVLLFIAGAFIKPPLGPVATAADFGSFAVRPEWYVLPMHSLMNLFQGINPKLAFVGSMVIPGFVVATLLLLPWLAPDGRKISRVAKFVLPAVLTVLFAMSIGSVAPPVGTQIVADAKPSSEVLSSKVSLSLAAAGKKVFAIQACGDCHKIRGMGGKAGPDLTDEAARHADVEWHVMHLKDPVKMSPGSTMPSFAKLSDSDLTALAHYVISKK